MKWTDQKGFDWSADAPPLYAGESTMKATGGNWVEGFAYG